jgi:hypothetical protein
MPVFGRLHFTLHDADEIVNIALVDSEPSNFLVIPRFGDDEQQIGEYGYDQYIPPSLTEICKFDEMLCRIERNNPNRKLVICAGKYLIHQAQIAFLVRLYLIISRGIKWKDAYTALKKMHGIFDLVLSSKYVGLGLSIRICLSAIYAAKIRKWIDFRENFNALPARPQSIHIDEYMHNGR